MYRMYCMPREDRSPERLMYRDDVQEEGETGTGPGHARSCAPDYSGG
jgi:hypothetical protein